MLSIWGVGNFAIVDKVRKFTAEVKDTNGKFAAGVTAISCNVAVNLPMVSMMQAVKFNTNISDDSGAPWVANIFVNKKNWRKLCVVRAEYTNNMAGIPTVYSAEGNAAHPCALCPSEAKTIGPRVNNPTTFNSEA